MGIKLTSSKGVEIDLTEAEWDIIVNSKTVIEKYFEQSYDQYNFIPIFTSYGLAIEQSNLNETLLIKISKDNRWMLLGKASFIYLFKMIQLIKMRMTILKNLNFKNYFEETLATCMEMGGDILDNVRYYCDQMT